MSYSGCSIEEFFHLAGRYPHHGPQSQYARPFSSSANVEHSTQKLPPAPIDLWDDACLASFIPSSSVAQASTVFPVQTSLSGTPVLPQSYVDIVANNSRSLPVAAPVPVPHAARTKAALRTVMSFDDQDKEGTHNYSAIGGKPLKNTDAHTRVNFDKQVLHSNVQTTLDYNTLVHSGNNEQITTTGLSKLVIRPISPSTLMALTEPCLVAWCTPFDESLAESGSSAHFPLQNLDYNHGVIDKNINVWGY